LNIALDHNVIETRGQAHFTQTTNQSLRITVKLSSHKLATIVEHLSNQNPKRDIFHSEFNRGVAVGLYHIVTRSLSLAAAKNQTEYPSNHFERPKSLHRNIL